MKKTLALAAVVLSLSLAGCSGKPPLNEESTQEEIHAYITDNGATIRGQDTGKYMKNVCTMIAEEGGLDAAADVKEIHGSNMSVEQAQRNVGAAVLTTCPGREHELEDGGKWW